MQILPRTDCLGSPFDYRGNVLTAPFCPLSSTDAIQITPPLCSGLSDTRVTTAKLSWWCSVGRRSVTPSTLDFLLFFKNTRVSSLRAPPECPSSQSHTAPAHASSRPVLCFLFSMRAAFKNVKWPCANIFPALLFYITPSTLDVCALLLSSDRI